MCLYSNNKNPLGVIPEDKLEWRRESAEDIIVTKNIWLKHKRPVFILPFPVKEKNV